jgi:hypothetical protein
MYEAVFTQQQRPRRRQMKRILNAFIAVVLSAALAMPSYALSEFQVYNYKTGTYESFDSEAPANKMREFIPQNLAAQGLYDTYIGMGKSPSESVMKVLESVIGAHEKSDK